MLQRSRWKPSEVDLCQDDGLGNNCGSRPAGLPAEALGPDTPHSGPADTSLVYISPTTDPPPRPHTPLLSCFKFLTFKFLLLSSADGKRSCQTLVADLLTRECVTVSRPRTPNSIFCPSTFLFLSQMLAAGSHNTAPSSKRTTTLV